MTWARDGAGRAVVELALTSVGAGGVFLNATVKCNQTYGGECCAGAGLVTARVCVAEDAAACATGDGAVALDAAMALGAEGDSALVLTTVDALPAGARPRFLSMFETDFPLCAVVDVERGLAMSPFAYVALEEAA